MYRWIVAMDTMNNKLKNDTILFGIGKYGAVIITLLTTSILSHLLSPEEYGIVAVTTVFTALFNVFADFGFGTAIIQNKTLTDEDINSIFSFTVYLSIGLGLIFMLLGYPIAAFYDNFVYREICAWLGISVFFNALNIVPHGMVMKSKRFGLAGKRLLCASVFTGAAAIAMAYAGFSYYALVFQSVLQAVFMFVWNMWNVRLRFIPRLRMDSVRKISRYSLYQFACSMVNYGSKNFDSLLIGKIMGSENLAYYDKGYRLMMYPVDNLRFVINPVMHPILSEHQQDRDYIYETYIKVVRVLSLLGVLFTAICFWGSEEIILLFFGGQWKRSIPLFQILALSVWPQLVSSSTSAIYQSTGNTRLMFQSSIIHLMVSAALIVAGILVGKLEAVSVFVTMAMYFRFFIDYFFLIKKNFKREYLSFLAEFISDAILLLMLLTTAWGLSKISFGKAFVALLLKGMITMAVFAVGVVLTGRTHFLGALLKRTQKRR